MVYLANFPWLLFFKKMIYSVKYLNIMICTMANLTIKTKTRLKLSRRPNKLAGSAISFVDWNMLDSGLDREGLDDTTRFRPFWTATVRQLSHVPWSGDRWFMELWPHAHAPVMKLPHVTREKDPSSRQTPTNRAHVCLFVCFSSLLAA